MDQQLPTPALWMAAYQWNILTRFAGDFPFLRLYHNAATEAALYIQFMHGFTPEEWKEVEAFTRESRPDIEEIEADSRDVLYTDPEAVEDTLSAANVAQNFRLFYGFAAQYTVAAFAIAQDFVMKRHNMGPAEWEAVEAFLVRQDYFRQGGRFDSEAED